MKCEVCIDSINIVSYNIPGLKNKISEVNFLRGFEIFFLFETFIGESEQTYYESLFNNFHLFWIGVRKGANFGRAKEGSLFAIKKNMKHGVNCSFVSYDNQILIEIITPISKIHIMPVYINCTNWA